MTAPAEPLKGNEPFSLVDRSVLDFWRWAYSDLVNNTTRGVLAEYVIAVALGCDAGVREEWAPHDLTTAEGIKVEVKSSAYVQSWKQTRPSRITFSIRRTKPWNSATGTYPTEATRSADVYVFALLGEDRLDSVDPLDLDRWTFFVLPTRVLDALPTTKQSVTLKDLDKLGAGKASVATLRTAVADALEKRPR